MSIYFTLDSSCMFNPLEDYIKHPLPPRIPEAYDVERIEKNNMCADTLHVFLCIQNNILTDFGHQGNISMTGRGSISFLHDILCGTDIDTIENTWFAIFAENNITTTEKRKNTLALPLISIINGIKKYKHATNYITIEKFLET